VDVNGGCVESGVTPIGVPLSETAIPVGFELIAYVQAAALAADVQATCVFVEPVGTGVGVDVGDSVGVTDGDDPPPPPPHAAILIATMTVPKIGKTRKRRMSIRVRLS
jgi:hypothetical protein